MTKSEMMKKAHGMARFSLLRGDSYAVNFSAALRAVWGEKKEEDARRARAIAQARKVRDGKFFDANIASLAMDFGGFRRWERDESRRYCNAEALEGDRCYAMVNSDGAVTFINAFLASKEASNPQFWIDRFTIKDLKSPAIKAVKVFEKWQKSR
jgi:uncharacterized protein YcbX